MADETVFGGKTAKQRFTTYTGRIPPSPLGATPRPGLKQKYSYRQILTKSFLSEFDLSE